MIACAEPQERGREPESLGVYRSGNSLQIIAGRKNSGRADESGNLKQERVEGGEINQAESAEENPARPEAAGTLLADRLRTQQPVGNRRERISHRPAII